MVAEVGNTKMCVQEASCGVFSWDDCKFRAVLRPNTDPMVTASLNNSTRQLSGLRYDCTWVTVHTGMSLRTLAKNTKHECDSACPQWLYNRQLQPQRYTLKCVQAEYGYLPLLAQPVTALSRSSAAQRAAAFAFPLTNTGSLKQFFEALRGTIILICFFTVLYHPHPPICSDPEHTKC